jgi:hypothetical protein
MRKGRSGMGLVGSRYPTLRSFADGEGLHVVGAMVCGHCSGVGAGLGSLIFGEEVEGEVVVAAGEEGLYGFDEELVGGGGVGEEGHGGVELEVVGGAEDLADGDVSGEEDESGAFVEARAENGVGEVGRGFVERGDGVRAGSGARTEAVELREDEPDPVRGFVVVVELVEDGGVDGGLGG